MYYDALIFVVLGALVCGLAPAHIGGALEFFRFLLTALLALFLYALMTRGAEIIRTGAHR